MWDVHDNIISKTNKICLILPFQKVLSVIQWRRGATQRSGNLSNTFLSNPNYFINLPESKTNFTFVIYTLLYMGENESLMFNFDCCLNIKEILKPKIYLDNF